MKEGQGLNLQGAAVIGLYGLVQRVGMGKQKAHPPAIRAIKSIHRPKQGQCRGKRQIAGAERVCCLVAILMHIAF